MNGRGAYPIENADYWIQYKVMPPKIYAFIHKHTDGTFTVFIDPRRSKEQQKKDLQHEIDHILNDDFYNDKSILEVEGRTQ